MSAPEPTATPASSASVLSRFRLRLTRGHTLHAAWLGCRRCQVRLGRHWRHSVGVRLVALFLVLAVAISLITLGGLERAFGMGWRDVGRPLVADYVDRLAADIGSPPDLVRAQALADRLPLVIAIDGPALHWRSARHEPAHRAPTPAAEAHASLPVAAPPEPFSRNWAGPTPRDWLTRQTADGHRILFGIDTETLHRRPRAVGALTLALLLTLVLVTWGVVRHLIRPLQDIGAGAERFGRGDFSQPIPVRRPNELGQLAERVNTMAHDLAGMLDAKRALLLALSHELRSPLTRARLNAELVAEGPERDALLRDLGEMRELISDLLESERLAQPHASLQREATELPALLRPLLAAGPGTARPLQLNLDPTLPPGWVDRQRLTLLLRNLLDNAWRHGAGAPQPPELRACWHDGQLQLSLRDHGPGVEPAQLARLAEPFHRTDAARARATGGVGLGLYLSRLVAQAHGGSLRFENAQPGLRVQLTLPWPAPPP